MKFFKDNGGAIEDFKPAKAEGPNKPTYKTFILYTVDKKVQRTHYDLMLERELRCGEANIVTKKFFAETKLAGGFTPTLIHQNTVQVAESENESTFDQVCMILNKKS